jgi:hypothetical protein
MDKSEVVTNAAAKTSADVYKLAIHGWDYGVITVVIILCFFAFLYARNRKKSDTQLKTTYRVTPWFNATALAIAVFAAQYPILKLDWLPETTLPDVGQYAFRMIAWFLVTLAVIRFVWTLTTLWDSDRLYLTGEPATDQDPEEVAERIDLPARTLEKAAMLLLDKQVHAHLITLQSRGYYWVLFAYIGLVTQRVAEFQSSYIAYVWEKSNIRRDVPDEYWKIVNQAIKDRQPAEDLDTAKGTAYYVRSEDVVVLIAGKNDKAVTKLQVTSFMQFFDTFWRNI